MRGTIEQKKAASEYFQIKVPGVSEEKPKRDEAKAFIIENVLREQAEYIFRALRGNGKTIEISTLIRLLSGT